MNKLPVFIFSFLCLISSSLSAQDSLQTKQGTIDVEALNEAFLAKINKQRKLAKVPELTIHYSLQGPADQHSNYMAERSKTTHRERSKYSRWAKDRSNSWGAHFKEIDECVYALNPEGKKLQTALKKEKKLSYTEVVAEVIFDFWIHCRGYKEDLMNSDFRHLYISLTYDRLGNAYFCLLLGDEYFEYPPEVADSSLYKYKPLSPFKCYKCNLMQSATSGSIQMDADRNLFFVGSNKFRPFIARRIACSNPWRDGLAADIVLKRQYSCEDGIVLNGELMVDGIPLQPIFRKDFGKKGKYGLFQTNIYLGTVPEWIKEDFEVNLNVINKKRVCSQTIFHVIPIYLLLDLHIRVNVSSDTLAFKDLRYDTVSLRVYYPKAIDTLSRAQTDSILSLVQEHSGKPIRAEISGYASIDGNQQSNQQLFERRSENMFQLLQQFDLNSLDVSRHMSENFTAFREDIRNTPFAYLGAFPDSVIQKELERTSLSDSLEYILKEHRYSELTIYFQWEEELVATKDTINQLFDASIAHKNRQEAEKLQAQQFDMVFSNEMSLSELDEHYIPLEKKYMKLLHNRAVVHFMMDSLNEERLDILKNEIEKILPADTQKVVLKTTLAKIEYFQDPPGTRKGIRQFARKKYVDKRELARMVIMLCYSYDIDHKRNSMRSLAKRQVPVADLSIKEKFEFSRYLAYEGDYRSAYLLVKNLINKTEDPDDLVYFLKLIYLTEVSISHDEMIALFNRVRKHSGKEFCTYFNSPDLNFQILKDPDLMKIYCRECNE